MVTESATATAVPPSVGDLLHDGVGDIARRVLARHPDAVVGDDDPGTGCGGGHGDGPTDPSSGAGDGDHLVLEIAAH